MRVLLTGARAPVTLDLARRFNAYGATVYLADSLRFCSSRFSRSIKRFFLTPPANRDSQKYIAAINRIIRSEKIELLIPNCEEIFFLANAQEELECEVFVDRFDKLISLHNKWTFSQIATNDFGRAPETCLIKQPSQLMEFNLSSSDYVFKPVFSRFASQTLIRPDANSLNQIDASPNKPWIAQQFVQGTEYSTYSLARDGNLLAHCTYRSSFRAGLGAGICFFNDPYPKITDFTKQLVAQTSFTGQLGLDCIVDENENVWVIECNPRATSGIHLFHPESTLVESFLEKNESFFEVNTERRYMVAAAMLTFALPSAILSGRTNDYIRDLVRSKDVLFQWSDPKPFLTVPLALAELCWIALSQRVSIQDSTTRDIEWNGYHP